MMAFDIYGEHLERGHCEVHPWVGEEYPCSLCLAATKKRRQEVLEYEQAMIDMERKAYAAYMADLAYESFTAA